MNDVHARFFPQLLRRYPRIPDIVEIGFNTGHSSYLFLSSLPDVRVLSFDLGEGEIVDVAKRLIDQRFPSRHELIRGDSRQTVPAFADANPGRHFDLIFIDGGHEYDVASSDIANCENLGGPQSFAIIDDINPWSWGVGPTNAWRDAIATDLVDPLLLLEDGFPLCDVALADVRPLQRGWVVGRYRSGRSAPGTPDRPSPGLAFIAKLRGKIALTEEK